MLNRWAWFANPALRESFSPNFHACIAIAVLEVHSRWRRNAWRAGVLSEPSKVELANIPWMFLEEWQNWGPNEARDANTQWNLTPDPASCDQAVNQTTPKGFPEV